MKLNTHETRCLHCGSARVCRSRRKSAVEYAIALAGWRVSRCHDCHARFLQFGRSLVNAKRLRWMAKGLLIGVVAAAAVAVVVAAILWFGHIQAGPASLEGLFRFPPSRSARGRLT